MESGSCNRCQDPSSIFRGAPVSVASSRPSRIQVANFPARVRATGAPLKSFTAHSTPLTPRTRVRSVSFSALVCSKYSVFASITHTSASVTSRIWLPVRLRMLAKIDVWFSSRKVQKAIAKISPRYLARSPVNIFHAIKFMASALLTLFSVDDFALFLHSHEKARPVTCELDSQVIRIASHLRAQAEILSFLRAAQRAIHLRSWAIQHDSASGTRQLKYLARSAKSILDSDEVHNIRS